MRLPASDRTRGARGSDEGCRTSPPYPRTIVRSRHEGQAARPAGYAVHAARRGIRAERSVGARAGTRDHRDHNARRATLGDRHPPRWRAGLPASRYQYPAPARDAHRRSRRGTHRALYGLTGSTTARAKSEHDRRRCMVHRWHRGNRDHLYGPYRRFAAVCFGWGSSSTVPGMPAERT